MDLNLLLTFDALMQTRSVSAAAKRLNLSQPATSHALGRLRDLLGDPVLVRTREGMVPTARAERMFPSVRTALAQLQNAVTDVPTFDPATARRTFTIASADYFEVLMFPAFMQRLSKVAPGINVRSHRRVTLSELHRPEVDLVVTRVEDEAEAGFKLRKLFDDTFTVVMRKGHPLLRGKLTLDRYLAASHVVVSPRGKPGGFVDDALARDGRSRRVALTLSHFLVAPHVIAESDLICTMPLRIAQIYADKWQMREPPLVLPGFSIAMAWHERCDKDPAHIWLRNAIALKAMKSARSDSLRPARK